MLNVYKIKDESRLKPSGKRKALGRPKTFARHGY
ncbi:unnamed protein product, partial [Adineta steineri]